MNRRYFLRFLALSPLAALAASQSARVFLYDELHEWKPPQPLTPAMRAEFQRRFIDPVLSGEAELLGSRRFSITEIVRFMGVPPHQVGRGLQ